MRRKLVATALALAVGGLLLAGCGDDDDAEESSPSPSPSGAEASEAAGDGELHVVATEYAFEGMPETIEGGVITVEFRNDGEQPHELGLMRLERGLDAEAFGALVTPVFEGGPFADEILGHTGITEIEAGESVTSTIEVPEGEYAVYCSISDEQENEGEEAQDEGEEEPPPHFELGMYQPLTVEGANDAELPTGPSITATDYEFATEGLEAGEAEIVFHNDSDEQFHHVVLLGWGEGVDEAAAADAWRVLAESEEGAPPPEGTPEPEDEFGSQVFGPGTGGTFTAELKSGRTYTAICFIHDRAGGPPHAFGHDMVHHFTVQ